MNQSSLITDLPEELIGEITNYLLSYYDARLAQTCKQMNNRIWKFRKLLCVPEEIFERYFTANEFNIQRYIGLESLIIPAINPQITQLPHLTYLSFDYDGSADQATIINQLTHLRSLYIRAEKRSITNLREMLGENHQLTNLGLRSLGCPNGLFQLPVLSRLKAFSLSPQTFEEITLEGLFNMTNLTELSLVNVRVNPNDKTNFSRLINLQEIDLYNVRLDPNAQNDSYINFKEFGALKYLTKLQVSEQQLREEDYRDIGTLTSLECLEIVEYDNVSHVEYLSGLTNLTWLELYDGGESYSEQPLPFKYMAQLEDITIDFGGAIAQLQGLTRLTNLVVLGMLTAEQANDLGLLTQLCNLELIPSEIEEGEVDWSALVNVTSVIMDVGRSDEMTDLRLFELITQLQNMRKLNVGESIHDYMFDSLKQLTQLAKLNIDLTKRQFKHENWDLAALPFEVEFRE